MFVTHMFSDLTNVFLSILLLSNLKANQSAAIYSVNHWDMILLTW